MSCLTPPSSLGLPQCGCNGAIQNCYCTYITSPRKNDPPYKIYVASHVEVSSANAVPGGFARAPFHDPFPRPRVCSIPPAPPQGSHGHHPPAYHTHQRPSSAPAAPQCLGPGGAALPVITYIILISKYGGLFSLSSSEDKKGGI